MQSLLLCADSRLAEVVPLALARGLGIEAQAFYRPEILDDPAEAIAEHRRHLAGLAGPLSLHGPFADLCPGSLDPLVRQVAARRIDQVLTVAGELGAAHLVLHHGYVPHTSSPSNWIARSSVDIGPFRPIMDSRRMRKIARRLACVLPPAPHRPRLHPSARRRSSP